MEKVADVETRAAFDQCPNHVEVSAEGRLVERRRVRVGSGRVISVRIFTGIEQ